VDGRQAAQPRLDPPPAPPSPEHHRLDGVLALQDAGDEDQQGVPRFDEPLMMRRWGTPLLALAAARVLTAAAAVRAGVDPFRTESWVRFDAHLYLDIARQGYTLFPCP